MKFAHTVFALPFAMIGFTLAAADAQYQFSLRLFGLVLLCMVFARSAAMGFNRYVDREIDSRNPRTLQREIPSGKIKENSALAFTVLMAVLFIATTWFINPLCLFLSPIALIVVLGYSYTKRFTALAHFFLGLGLSLAPIGAYLAVTGEFNIVPILLSLSVLLWVGGFDVIYALQDEEFDKSNNLKSIPAMLGKKRALLVSVVVHFVSILLIITSGIIGPFGLLFWVGTAIFATLVIYQHMLVKPDDLSRINVAFFTMNGVASILFAVFVIADLLF